MGVEHLYDRLGGQPFFDRLVDDFYDGVSVDPVLRAMYPQDLTEPKEHLALFLAQFWGGPATYLERRGHPRLRLRHAPFVIDQAARDAWVDHMAAAVRASGVDDEVASAMLDYFDTSATFLMNA